MINLHESMGPGLDGTRAPGSAARQASVVRQITDCATQPGKLFLYNGNQRILTKYKAIHGKDQRADNP